MLVFVLALFGLIIGSFLNVVILRFGQQGIGGRSACPSCGTRLRWHDLIPVLSWLALRGRCRYCKARISVQYPLVEAGTAALFAGIGGAGLRPAPLVLALAIAALLVCIFVYDLRHKLIPDAWVWPFCACGLTFAFLSPYLIHDTLYVMLAGPVAAFPILFLWYLSKPFTGHAGMWMGFGDVKLSLGIGWLVGFPLGLIAIFFAFVIGAVISVCVLLPLPYLLGWWGLRPLPAAGGYTMKSEVPFGPFLIVSCLIVWFAVMYGVPLSLVDL